MNSNRRLFLFFLIVFLGRCLFSFSIGLIDDEAYHWSWAKEVSLSYFDHPAMIAWIEWVTTKLFGDTIFAVRLPALAFFCGSCYLLWKTAEEMFDRNTAFFATLLILFSPFFGFGGYVSSPEQPFMFFWLLGVYVFWKYASDAWSLKKSWISLGLIMGLGLNSKFIIALLALGFGVFMLMDTKKRKDLLSPWPWVGFGIATLLCLPIFIWNIQYDWPGFKYQFHDRHQGGGGFSLNRWLTFFVAQIVFLTPVVYFLTARIWIKSLTKSHELKWRFLLSLTLPSILIFYIQPFFADFKPHWSGAAYLTLFIGVGYLWSQSSKRKLITHLTMWFFIPMNLLIYSPFLYPWWPKAHRLVSSSPWQTTYDLSNEFHGWEELGQRLVQMQTEISARNGKTPFLASHRYETTAQTYWGARQKTYMLSRVVSHYTVVQNKDLENLAGSDALFITTEKYPGDPMKEAKWNSCTPEKFDYFRRDELSRQFTIWHCQNFQGLL